MAKITCSVCKTKMDISSGYCGMCGKHLGKERAEYDLLKYAYGYYMIKKDHGSEVELKRSYELAENAIREYNRYSEDKLPLNESGVPFANEDKILRLGKKLSDKLTDFTAKEESEKPDANDNAGTFAKIRYCAACDNPVPAAAVYCDNCGCRNITEAKITPKEEDEIIAKTMKKAVPVEKTDKYKLYSLGTTALPLAYILVIGVLLFFIFMSTIEHENWSREHFPNSANTSSLGFTRFILIMIFGGVLVSAGVLSVFMKKRREEYANEYEATQKADIFRIKQLYFIRPGQVSQPVYQSAAQASAYASVNTYAQGFNSTPQPMQPTAGGFQKLRFNSISETNVALMSFTDIADINVNYDTTSTYGYLANHSKLSQVSIDLLRTGQDNGRIYQLAEHEYTHFYFEDRSNMTEKLQRLNPNVRIVSVKSVTNTRGQGGLDMMLGIGVSSHRKVFVLYCLNKGQYANIVF